MDVAVAGFADVLVPGVVRHIRRRHDASQSVVEVAAILHRDRSTAVQMMSVDNVEPTGCRPAYVGLLDRALRTLIRIVKSLRIGPGLSRQRSCEARNKCRERNAQM